MSGDGTIRGHRRSQARFGGLTVFALVLALAGAGYGATAAASATTTGYRWTRSPDGAVGLGNLNGLATDGRRFVAVGLNRSEGPGAPIWTSNEGLTWKQARGPSSAFPPGTVVSKVVHDGKRFVAFGRPSPDEGLATLAWSSTNGTRWSRGVGSGLSVPPGYYPEALSVTASGLLLLVVNPDVGYALWRLRGNRWDQVGAVTLAGGASDVVEQIAASGPGFVAVGRSRKTAGAWASDDGASWSAASIQDLDPETFSSMQDMVTLGSKLVAVGVVSSTGSETGAAWSSSDGSTWRQSDPAPFFQEDLDASGSTALEVATVDRRTVLAAGSDGSQVAVWASPDGAAWTRVPGDPSLEIHTGTIAEATGVAVADGRVVITFREMRFTNGDSDLVGLGIVSGTKRR